MTVDATTINKEVEFESENRRDEIQYRGVVKGLVTYDVAKTYNGQIDLTLYRDIINTQRANASPVVDPLGDLEDLNYFLIALNEDREDQEVLKIFANEFIESGSFNTLSERVTLDLRIWGISDMDENKILALLRSNDYPKVRVLRKTS